MTNSTLFGTLYKAGFYYKGQGLLIDNKSWDLNGVLEVFENAIAGYVEGIKDHGVKSYFQQLDQIKKSIDKKGIFDQDMDIVWAMNIYVLTKLGYITNDNNNGTQFMYSKSQIA
jgi:hypothetical protein